MSNSFMQAVIFDMDGLLIDSEPLWHESEHGILNAIGVDTSRVNPVHTLGLRIDQTVHLHYQHSPWQDVSVDWVISRIIEETTQKIIDRRPLLPGVHEALALCASLDLKIGLASASPLKLIETVVELFGIGHYFEAITSAEHLPYSKPHPEVYLLAAEKLKVSPLRCVSLEDSFNGMIASKAARMRSIVVPDTTISDDPRWALADVKLDTLLSLRQEDLL